MFAFIFGVVVGAVLRHFIQMWGDADKDTYKIDQSNNVAGGDIVGRDKTDLR